MQGVAGCSLGFGHLPAAALDKGKNMYFHPLSTKQFCKKQKHYQPREPCLEGSCASSR